MTRNLAILFGGLLLAFFLRAQGAQPELPGDDLKFSLWDYSGEVRGGLGYKDNVALSNTNAYGSAFWRSSGEFILFRLPSGGWQFHFFADASDVRYFDSPSVSDEQFVLAVAQLSKDLGRNWKATVGLNYMYQNQVFDYSANYTNQMSVGKILGHTVAPRWAARKSLGRFWAEGEFNGTRQWLDEPLDGFWQYGPRASVGYSLGNGSEVALNYQHFRLDYDNREQIDRSGTAVPNTALSLDVDAVEAVLTYSWDARRRWQTATTLGYESTRDNGSGFFDYDYYRFAQRIRFRNDEWDVAAGVRVGHYAYATQTVSATDTEPRDKTMLSLTVRIERRLWKHLKAHASYNWDRSFSNLAFDDYEASVVMGGLAFTF